MGLPSKLRAMESCLWLKELLAECERLHGVAESLALERPVAHFVEQARLRQRASRSRLHGVSHWKGVSFLGNLLAKFDSNASARVGVLFGLFHDLERHNDGCDPEHGARVATLLGQIGRCELGLKADEFELLLFSCQHHSTGRCHRNVTVGCCWDADRLTLWRCAITPDVKLLSTHVARAEAMLNLGKMVTQEVPTWHEVFEPLCYLRRILSGTSLYQDENPLSGSGCATRIV
jgi:uncharacterized protein